MGRLRRLYSKPVIEGHYNSYDLYGNSSIPMFSQWIVYWYEDASCGHRDCGVDSYEENFATWSDAMKFALELGWQD